MHRLEENQRQGGEKNQKPLIYIHPCFLDLRSVKWLNYSHSPKSTRASKTFIDVTQLSLLITRNSLIVLITTKSINSSVGLDDYVKVPWMSELMDEVKDMTKANTDECACTRNRMLMFCADCKVCCCYDCAKTKHHAHSQVQLSFTRAHAKGLGKITTKSFKRLKVECFIGGHALLTDAL